MKIYKELNINLEDDVDANPKSIRKRKKIKTRSKKKEKNYNRLVLVDQYATNGDSVGRGGKKQRQKNTENE